MLQPHHGRRVRLLAVAAAGHLTDSQKTDRPIRPRSRYARFGMLGPVYANLDLAAYSMAIAAGIGCCSNNGAPCRACIQGLAPDDPVNKTMAGENTAEVNRLVRILSRWRCFGGDVAQAPSEFSQSLGAKTEDLRYIANGGCACSDCPPAKCSSEDDGWWLYYALPVGGVALIVAAGCLYRRRRAQLAPTSACSEGEIQRTLLV